METSPSLCLTADIGYIGHNDTVYSLGNVVHWVSITHQISILLSQLIQERHSSLIAICPSNEAVIVYYDDK